METGYLNLVKDGDWLWVNIIGLIAMMLLAAGLVWIGWGIGKDNREA